MPDPAVSPPIGEPASPPIRCPRAAPSTWPAWLSRALGAGLFVWIAIVTWQMTCQGPVGLDEGYNLTVPQALLTDGRYATRRASGFRDFDPAITTGPLVLAPVAVAEKLGGVSKPVARLVPLAYFFAMLALLATIARRAFGPAAALLALGLVASSWYVLGMAGVVLGEAAALCFVLAAFLLSERALGRAGWSPWAAVAAAYAGAVLCKYQSVLALAAPLALSLALAWRRAPRPWAPAAAAALGLGGGLALWVGAQWLALGPAGFAANLAYMRVFKDAVAAGARPGANLGLLYTLLPVPFFALIMGWSALQARRWLDRPLALQLGAFTAAWFAWWLLLDAMAFARHAFPAVVGFYALAAAWAVWSWRALGDWRPRALVRAGRAALALVMLGFGGSRFYATYLKHPAGGPSDQDRFVAWVAEKTPASAVFYGWSFFVPWELAFLTGRRVDAFPPEPRWPLKQPSYVVDTYGIIQGFPKVQRWVETHGRLVFANGVYRAYQLREDAERGQARRAPPSACQRSSAGEDR